MIQHKKSHWLPPEYYGICYRKMYRNEKIEKKTLLNLVFLTHKKLKIQNQLLRDVLQKQLRPPTMGVHGGHHSLWLLNKKPLLKFTSKSLKNIFKGIHFQYIFICNPVSFTEEQTPKQLFSTFLVQLQNSQSLEVLPVLQ